MIIAAMAISLYQYNINSFERADKLFQHFQGNCAEMFELIQLVDSKYWATEMAYPTAKIYIEHAMERYGAEAAERCRVNAEASEMIR